MMSPWRSHLRPLGEVFKVDVAGDVVSIKPLRAFSGHFIEVDVVDDGVVVDVFLIGELGFELVVLQLKLDHLEVQGIDLVWRAVRPRRLLRNCMVSQDLMSTRSAFLIEPLVPWAGKAMAMSSGRVWQSMQLAQLTSA